TSTDPTAMILSRSRSMDATLKTQASPRSSTTSGDSRGKEAPLSPDELRRLDAYWRASNYLSVGQIYLLDNPLLREPLRREHIKPRLLGHWGTSPGLNMLCVHLNRVIRRDDLDVTYIIGPGHGGPSLVAHAYLEGTYSEVYPETGPLATGWHGNKFLNPARDGCVLPILHLNGYKIANPCFLARIPKDELQKFFEGMGYKPYFVEGHDLTAVHQQLASVLDAVMA